MLLFNTRRKIFEQNNRSFNFNSNNVEIKTKKILVIKIYIKRLLTSHAYRSTLNSAREI